MKIILNVRNKQLIKELHLVKNTLDQLPIRPETHKRIRLYFLEGEKGGIYEAGSETLEITSLKN